MKLSITGETIESLLYHENRPVLELKLSYPQIMGRLSKTSEDRFNEYYRNHARRINRIARSEYYHRAAEAARIATEQEYDFTLHSLIRTHAASRIDLRYPSLVFDLYQYTGGLHGNTKRTGNTWDLASGKTVPLSWFFKGGAPYKRAILRDVTEQIKEQNKTGIFFFENPHRNAEKYFDIASYSLTEDSVAIHYPLYTLAPYEAGILTYEIPFDRLDRYWNPHRKPEPLPKASDRSDQTSPLRWL